MHVPCTAGAYCISMCVYFNDDEPYVFHLQANLFKFQLNFSEKYVELLHNLQKEVVVLQDVMFSHTKC